MKEENDSDSDDNQEHEIFQKLQKFQGKDKSFCKGLPVIIDNGMSLNGEDFFVMERLGVSLVDILKRNKLKFSYLQTCALGVQIVQALEKFHDLGYVHCDLKPDNILFGLPVKPNQTNRLSLFQNP